MLPKTQKILQTRNSIQFDQIERISSTNFCHRSETGKNFNIIFASHVHGSYQLRNLTTEVAKAAGKNNLNSIPISPANSGRSIAADNARIFQKRHLLMSWIMRTRGKFLLRSFFIQKIPLNEQFPLCWSWRGRKFLKTFVFVVQLIIFSRALWCHAMCLARERTKKTKKCYESRSVSDECLIPYKACVTSCCRFMFVSIRFSLPQHIAIHSALTHLSSADSPRTIQPQINSSQLSITKNFFNFFITKETHKKKIKKFSHFIVFSSFCASLKSWLFFLSICNKRTSFRLHLASLLASSSSSSFSSFSWWFGVIAPLTSHIKIHLWRKFHAPFIKLF